MSVELKILLFGLVIVIANALSGCCPFVVGPYEAAQERCLEDYQTDADVVADRDVACVRGVRLYERELRK